MGTYSASLAANAFLYKAKKQGAPLTHMKLQKLVFFAHAWSLAFDGKSVVKEQPQVWTYGPVFETLYHAIKGLGSRPVPDYLKVMNQQTGQRQALIPSLEDKRFWEILNQVWERYGGFSALQLSALTHEAGSPWANARSQNRGELDDAEIAEYYRGKLTQHGAG